MLRNLFCPRCSTQASGVLVVFKEGSEWWCGRCVNSWSTDPVKAEAWLAERRAEQREWEDEALKEEQHRQLAEDQEPEPGGEQIWLKEARVRADAARQLADAQRQHGVAGVSEYEDLPDWARAEIDRLREERDAAIQDNNKGFSDAWDDGRTAGLLEARSAAAERLRDALDEAEQGWGCRDWAAEAVAEHQGRTAGSLDAAQPEVCEDNRCDPCRLPGGWWCRACDKPLRLVRPLYRPDREDADG